MWYISSTKNDVNKIILNFIRRNKKLKTIKFFVFALFFVILFSKVTLAQGPIISIPSAETYFDDDYVFTYERFNFYGVPIETEKSYNFSICNSGNSPLIISEISVSFH